jgi:hypothetical protein
VPTPEQFLGFATFAEAEAIKKFLAHATIENVTKFMTRTFPALLKAGKVAYVRPENPQPPRDCPTVWLDGDDDRAGADTAALLAVLPEEVQKAWSAPSSRRAAATGSAPGR